MEGEVSKWRKSGLERREGTEGGAVRKGESGGDEGRERERE